MSTKTLRAGLIGLGMMGRHHARNLRALDGVELVAIDITGNAFLHNMVRTIAGSLVEVGRGHRAPSWLAEVLAAQKTFIDVAFNQSLFSLG